MASTPISEARVDVDGIEIFVRRTEGDGPPAVLFHGNPTNSDDWLDLMPMLRRPAIAFDLPGFGRSARPDPAEFDYSMAAYGRFIDRTLDALGVGRFAPVVHDWGSLGLLPVLAQPDRADRVVALNHVPFGVGYEWHWIARRFWRRRVAGEVFNAVTTRAAAGLLMRQARPGFRPMPKEFMDAWWSHYDRGTRRAVLGLYRSADPEILDRAGERLGELTCPALVLWPDEDPYIPYEYGQRFAARLPDAELVRLDRAGHWPWVDRADTFRTVAEYLAG